VFPDQARGYAQALLAAVDFLSEGRTLVPAGASGFGQVQSLQRRLEMILRQTMHPNLSTLGRVAAVVLALGVLPWNPRALAQPAPENQAQTPDLVNRPLSDTRPEKDALPQRPGGKPTTEERLDRLEKMLSQLLDRMPPNSPPPKFPAEAHNPADLQARIKALNQQIETAQSQLRHLQSERDRLQRSLPNDGRQPRNPPKDTDKPEGPGSKRTTLEPLSSSKGKEVSDSLPDASKPSANDFTSKPGQKVSLRGALDDFLAKDPASSRVTWRLKLEDLGRVLSIEHSEDRVTVTGERQKLVIDARTGKILSTEPLDPNSGNSKK